MSTTCFEHPCVHPQAELYMQFCGISLMRLCFHYVHFFKSYLSCVYCCNLMCICLSYLCFYTLCVFVISYVYLLYYMCIDILNLNAGLLARSQYPEGPATGHFDTGFSWFPCVCKRMLRWFSVSMLLLHASHIALPT